MSIMCVLSMYVQVVVVNFATAQNLKGEKMKRFLILHLKNKSLWAGFVIGLIFAVSAAYGLSAELAQTMMSAVLETIMNP